MSNHDYFFHEDEIALVQASETMGNLPDILQEIADESENTQKINQRIKKAVTYPAILVVFSIAAVIILLLYVVPTIVSMFPSQESLPGITKFMLSVSSFIKNARYVLVLMLIGAIILYKFLYRYFLPFKIFIDKIMLSIPAISGVIKTLYMFRFSRLLGQLYSAGVNPIISLQLMTNSFSNFFYKRKAKEIRTNLQAGFGFAESME
jgi:type IV pilus assembly protein PilC